MATLAREAALQHAKLARTRMQQRRRLLVVSVRKASTLRLTPAVCVGIAVLGHLRHMWLLVPVTNVHLASLPQLEAKMSQTA